VLTLTRFILTIALLTAMALPLTAVAEHHADVQTKETQAALTPEAALGLLKAGNERFLSGTMANRDLAAQVKATAGGQFPHSVVMGCIDSRVPPELVFDQGIGDIFTPRIAGNFVDQELLGSIEFATAVAGSKVVVVLGHSACGAVKGACDNVKLGNLTQTLSYIKPAVEAVPGFEGERNSGNSEFVQAVTHENVRLTVARMLSESLVLKKLVERGELLVVGAIYDLSTGQVTFLED
jgi:carbonic anhydrase